MRASEVLFVVWKRFGNGFDRPAFQTIWKLIFAVHPLGQSRLDPGRDIGSHPTRSGTSRKRKFLFRWGGKKERIKENKGGKRGEKCFPCRDGAQKRGIVEKREGWGLCVPPPDKLKLRRQFLRRRRKFVINLLHGWGRSSSILVKLNFSRRCFVRF